MKIRQYELPAGYTNAVFDPSLKLEEKGVLTIAPGQVFSVNPFERTVNYFLFEEQTVLIKINGAAVVPFEWSFDVESRSAWQYISTSPEESYLVHLCQAGASLKDDSLVPHLQQLIHRHPRHFVRWAALRALGVIDKRSGLSSLKYLLNDVHPHLRISAQRLLAATHPQ